VAKLELNAVKKVYGETVAVADFDLTIEDNEFFCIFGPPSTGKSTILRLLLGLETPDDGEIKIGEQVVNKQLPAERDLAMVFQNLALFPHMTAEENLAFPLVERKVPKAEMETRIREVADKLHIGPLLNKIPAHLSGGERQRVAIGRALVRDCNALLMDEPISALDARLREEMRVELKRLQREMHRTLVYVTHDQEEAMSVADRMCIMRDGGVAQIGTPQEIYNLPNSQYVAEVIGAPPINFIPCTRAEIAGAFLADGGDLALKFASDAAPGAFSFGIRPEDIVVGRSAEGSPSVAGTIYEVEPLGAFTIVDITVGDHVLRAQLAGQHAFELGEAVHLSFDAAKVHLFDGETGARLATGHTT
jgi:multiple sugar transport system ATP-binding protein